MDDRIEPIEASERQALLGAIQAVGAPGLALLREELVAAEARADIETIALWLAWATVPDGHTGRSEWGRASAMRPGTHGIAPTAGAGLDPTSILPPG